MNDNGRPKCINCDFYNAEDKTCRRYPPQVWSEPAPECVRPLGFNFPEVQENDWCGEFMDENTGWLYVDEDEELAEAVDKWNKRGSPIIEWPYNKKENEDE